VVLKKRIRNIIFCRPIYRVLCRPLGIFRFVFVIKDVVCAELYFGARNRQELTDIVANMENLTILPVSSKISPLAVDLVK
jgi:hypothetical protein